MESYDKLKTEESRNVNDKTKDPAAEEKDEHVG
jgi:hypothetical protein